MSPFYVSFRIRFVMASVQIDSAVQTAYADFAFFAS